MRLSDAMVLGSTLARHTPHLGAADDEGCALQLAVTAGHLFDFSFVYSKVNCPGCGRSTTVRGVIVCLNDNHVWSIEAIADWVRSKEPSEVASPASTSHTEEVVPCAEAVTAAT